MPADGLPMCVGGCGSQTRSKPHNGSVLADFPSLFLSSLRAASAPRGFRPLLSSPPHGVGNVCRGWPASTFPKDRVCGGNHPRGDYRCDVLVFGAGPSGASCAYWLAKVNTRGGAMIIFLLFG